MFSDKRYISTRNNEIKSPCLRFFIFPLLFLGEELKLAPGTNINAFELPLSFLIYSILFISCLGANNHMVIRYACVLVVCHSKHSLNVIYLDA